jgi:Zn-finger nucleic acid-binding protein
MNRNLYAKQHNNSLPYTFYCPKCNFVWYKGFAPKSCPKCGAKVSDASGIPPYKASANMSVDEKLIKGMKIMDEYVGLTLKGYLSQTIIQCPKCNYRSPKFPEKELRMCPRCQIEMVDRMPLRNILHRIRRYWRYLYSPRI